MAGRQAAAAGAFGIAGVYCSAERHLPCQRPCASCPWAAPCSARCGSQVETGSEAVWRPTGLLEQRSGDNDRDDALGQRSDRRNARRRSMPSGARAPMGTAAPCAPLQLPERQVLKGRGAVQSSRLQRYKSIKLVIRKGSSTNRGPFTKDEKKRGRAADGCCIAAPLPLTARAAHSGSPAGAALHHPFLEAPLYEGCAGFWEGGV